MKTTKAALRQIMREERRQITEKARKTHAAAAAKLLLEAFPNASTWLLYRACHSEADPVILEQQLRKRGIIPAFPRVNNARIEFCPIPNPDTDWKTGPFSIPEPAPQLAPVNRFSPDTVIVVPGLAFAPDGSRLGYGGGYYDRFLQNFPGISVGFFFPFQYVHNIMTFAHDQPVQYLCDGKNLFSAKEFPGRVYNS